MLMKNLKTSIDNRNGLLMTLNKNLDTKALAKAYKVNKRLQIPDFLETATADKIYQVLTTKTPWQFSYNDGKKALWQDPKEFEMKIGRRLREMTANIFEAAAGGKFQYVRFARPLGENQTGMKPLDPALVDVYDFLNGKEVKAFVKAVTGKTVKEADAEVHWYQNDHFQTCGNGTERGKKSGIGFSLNLAWDWTADWGGNTLFYDQTGNVEELFIPGYNSLEIFEIPTTHSISTVATYAPSHRLSITGAFLA